MLNPFLSTPEATVFWREQQQACEEARRLLCKTPEFAAFLAAGGTLAVVPDGFPISCFFVAILKDGDSMYAAIPFYAVPEHGHIMVEPRRVGAVKNLTAWLTEARDGAKYVRPEIKADDIVSGRIFICENGALYRLVKEGLLRLLPLPFREKYWAAEGRDATECYIQVEGYVGDAMCWWRKGGGGYTCDIREAEMFPVEEAERIARSDRPGKYTVRLCSDIEARKEAQKLIIDCHCMYP